VAEYDQQLMRHRFTPRPACCNEPDDCLHDDQRDGGSCTSTVTWAADDNYTGATRSQTTTAEKINPIVNVHGGRPRAPANHSAFTVASTTNSSATPVYTSGGVCSNLGPAYTR